MEAISYVPLNDSEVDFLLVACSLGLTRCFAFHLPSILFHQQNSCFFNPFARPSSNLSIYAQKIQLAGLTKKIKRMMNTISGNLVCCMPQMLSYEPRDHNLFEEHVKSCSVRK